MITENSFNATPEELVGKSDDTLNATATDCNPAVEEVVDAQVEAADVAAADFAEEDAALDAEKAGLAIGEEMAEEESAADVDKGDLNGRSKQELVDLFSSLLESEPVQTLRKSVEAIKIAFYKQHRAEVDAARKSFEAEHGQEAEFTPAVDALEVRLKELFKEYRRRRDEYIVNLDSIKEENLKTKLAIIEELKELVNSDETLNNTFSKFRDLQQRWKDTGVVPHPLALPKGCKFAPRCKYATQKCLEQEPELVEVMPGQKIRCHYPVKEVRNSEEHKHALVNNKP